MLASVAKALAPSGVLRAGINLSNFLLVSSFGSNNEPQGVAPDLAAHLAKSLGVPLQLVPYKNPGLLADAAESDEWDVGLIGAEPQRAEVIAFSQPYVEIQATFLVPPGSPLTRIEDVDRAGTRVAVSRSAAYCLWLENNLEHATLLQTEEPGLALSRELFLNSGCDALAGLRPWLLAQQEEVLRDSTVLDGSFTSVLQSIGVPRNRADGGASIWIERLVEEAKASGLVMEIVEKHGVADRLTVAA
mmetsp:Transcript_22119/g.44365  ORF Transcript_22119/g.44365 Transcript_22119/m.44365 type:complete len:246 (+) Transcript_22119:111-848(+)